VPWIGGGRGARLDLAGVRPHGDPPVRARRISVLTTSGSRCFPIEPPVGHCSWPGTSATLCRPHGWWPFGIASSTGHVEERRANHARTESASFGGKESSGVFWGKGVIRFVDQGCWCRW
jgi:hypothetical protein